MRTDKEIEEEIKKLEVLKGKVKPVTIFGDDNIARIDAEIEVLRERMDEDEIYDNLEWGEDEELVSDLLDVVRWLEEEEGVESPSKNWGY